MFYTEVRKKVAVKLGMEETSTEVIVLPLKKKEVEGDGPAAFVVDGLSATKVEDMAYALAVGEHTFLLPMVIGGWVRKGTNTFASLSGFDRPNYSIRRSKIKPDNLRRFTPGRLVEDGKTDGAETYLLAKRGMVASWVGAAATTLSVE